MDIDFNINREFTPTSYGNEDKPIDEQITIKWALPTPAERDRIRVISPMRFKTDGKIIDEMTFQYDKVELIKNCVLSIVNLSVKGKAIKTGRELANARGLGKLFDEVCTEIIPQIDIDIEDKKK